MDFKANRLPYRQTGYFSSIVLDYLDQSEAIKPFFAHPPSLQGIKKAIEARKSFSVRRTLLVEQLEKQYATVTSAEKVKQNIRLLAEENTFTITTAHQNNIFTGPLYFIYKILHTIKLAAYLGESLPGYKFVPVYYIGSEDADLAELNHIYLDGNRLTWDTNQSGAVGRMKIDKELTKLIDQAEGQLGVLPHGKEVTALLRNFYKAGNDIQTATFHFVHELFSEKGLVILLPDNAALKGQMKDIFEDDLLHQTASEIVEKEVLRLQKAGYKAQASPREINLFYLKDNIRERIEKTGDHWRVLNSTKKFTRDELLREVRENPECFSPNVILRGLYQEMILPDIAFIGGGGETAYWLQLKSLFDHYKIPFPVLVLRNSFLVVEKKWREKITKLGFNPEDFFLPEQELLNRLVSRDTANELKLNGSLADMEMLYEHFKKQAAAVDSTLVKHVDSLKLRSVHRLQELEKKMLRAEKRKFADQQRQIHAVKDHLFPGDGLQERRENISSYYARWGKEFLDILYNHSLALEQEFVLLTEIK